LKNILGFYFIFYIIKVQPAVRQNLLDYYLSDRLNQRDSASNIVPMESLQDKSPKRHLSRRSTAKIKGKYLVKLSIDSPLLKQNTADSANLQKQIDESVTTPLKPKSRFASKHIEIQEEADQEKNLDEEYQERSLKRSVVLKQHI
jgi:hypothetical protein